MSVRTEQFAAPVSQRLVIGPGAIDQLGAIVDELNAEHVLLVTDPGIVAAGHVDHTLMCLVNVGVTVFDQVRENPTTAIVDACLQCASPQATDLIIGLGGGSSMDTAKGCNFLLTNGGNLVDYWGIGKATQPMLPMIAVPTTAGTGSECQSYALISDDATHRKMACGDPKALPAVAILDPQLTFTQPAQVTANSGIDALAHAIETAVTTKRNSLSIELSKKAFATMCDALGKVLQGPGDLQARSDMQYGAALSGRAIELSMLGAAHAAANPLTARYGIVHGSAVGLMLPHVVRYNGEDPTVAEQYRQTTGVGPADLADMIVQWMTLAGLPTTLGQCAIDDSAIDALASDAAEQWTGTFNPRPMNAQSFAALYRQAL